MADNESRPESVSDGHHIVLGKKFKIKIWIESRVGCSGKNLSFPGIGNRITIPGNSRE